MDTGKLGVWPAPGAPAAATKGKAKHPNRTSRSRSQVRQDPTISTTTSRSRRSR